MENIPEPEKQKVPTWRFDPSLNEHVILGEELPDELRKYFFGFDFEVQLSNLPKSIISYIGASIDQINMLINPLKKIESGESTTSDPYWFRHEIEKINTEIKEIIKSYRGVDGFTMKELGTVRELGKQDILQRSSKTGGWFKPNKGDIEL